MEETQTCTRCKTNIPENEVFCSQCGFPERGTKEQQGQYLFKIKIREDGIEEAKKKIENVQLMLFILAGINIGYGLLFWGAFDGPFEDVIAGLILGVVFVGCGFYVVKRPMVGVLVAFSIWILLQILFFIVEPSTIFSGLIIKVVIIVIFVRGINSARDARQFQSELDELSGAR